jgi:hypothetical protein
MTEPEKKDFKFLDDIEDQPRNNGYTGKIMIGLMIALLGLGLTFWWGKFGVRESLTSNKNPQTSDPKNDLKDAQYADVINFAEKFTIMAFNLSYTDINRQTEKVGSLMSDNIMSYYQEAFLDPKWVAFLTSNKAYVSYQQVERSSVENADGTHYWVKVIGKNLYNSDARGMGSQIELPFHMVVVVKNENGKLVVTNFQRL